MEQEPKTPRERAAHLIRLLVPDWRPTLQQVLWAIRIGIVLSLTVAISYSYGITFWDWIKVLIVPATLALGAVWLNQKHGERERAAQAAQRSHELTVAREDAEDQAVQAYLDDMSQLLLNQDRPLRQSKEGDEVRTLAQARTSTTLGRLSGGRRGRILQFLYTSGLIARENPVLLLDRVLLAQLVFRGADLKGASLGGANLIEADLGPATWDTAYKPETPYQVYRVEATILEGANLEKATLGGATLQFANLRSAFMLRADLTGAYLGGADLTGAHVTEEQLAKVKSLEQATMPDGQKYEDWIKDKESRGEEGENSGTS